MCLQVDAPSWERTPLIPRLPPQMADVLRGLASPAAAAAAVLARATGLPDDTLARLRTGDVTEAGPAGVHIRTPHGRFLVPADAAAPIRALLDDHNDDNEQYADSVSRPLLGATRAAGIGRLRTAATDLVGAGDGPGPVGRVKIIDNLLVGRRAVTDRRLNLDWGLIEQRRVAAGLTRAELAERLGRAGGNSAYWWPSRAVLTHDYDHLTLVDLDRLCAALDLHPAELFTTPTRKVQRQRTPPSRAAQARDDAVLEAAFTTLADPVGHGALADALGWPLDRLREALDTLEQRLGDTGMRVDHDPGPPAVIRGLRRRDAVLTETQRTALHRLGDRDTGLDPYYARLLYSIAIIGLAPTETSRGTDPAAAIKLQRLGYVRRRHNSEHLAASNELAFSLLLDELEPKYWRPAATYPA